MNNLPVPGTLYRKFNVQELIDMTLKKAYTTLVIVCILAIITVVLFAVGVSKMAMEWGIFGYLASLFVALATLLYGIYSLKQEKVTDNASILVRYRYEILDWISFLGTSMMVIFIIFMFWIIPSVVSQNSMEPTLSNDDRIIVYHFRYQPKAGDIAIYRKTSPFTDTIFLIKRIVAVPGDQIAFIDDPNTNQMLIVINGEVARNPAGDEYLISSSRSQSIIDSDLIDGILQDDKFLIFGDNADYEINAQGNLINISEDSRSFGAVHETDLLGRATMRFWPFEVFR